MTAKEHQEEEESLVVEGSSLAAAAAAANPESETPRRRTFTYHITGRVAHGRILPLLLRTAADHGGVHWVPAAAAATGEASNNSVTMKRAPDFLWENAPRHESKPVRDFVRCYSHLPNGGALLDSKWVLGRLLGGGATESKDPPHLATLETHCFRGIAGFRCFAERVGLSSQEEEETTTTSNQALDKTTMTSTAPRFRDLMKEYDIDKTLSDNSNSTIRKPDLWVVKDSHSNGAGGIWVVGPANAQQFATVARTTHNDSNRTTTTTPLYEDHTYVAQAYAWPPVLFRRRKCHVRVYALLTADGRAHCHRRCFLHVANDDYFVRTDSSRTVPVANENDENRNCNMSSSSNNDCNQSYKDSVHITNCCANSHDDSKFAGEICADLEAWEHTRRTTSGGETATKDGNDAAAAAVFPDHELSIGLAPFFPSIRASIAALAARAGPFLRGGRGNAGFEYCGLDFILSYNDSTNQQQPVAYLLEVNAPPSQDTATGLPHAEDLHDEVIRDLLTLWVYPSVLPGAKAVRGGWRCVYQEEGEEDFLPIVQRHEADKEDEILPSKAAILNKIRWTLYERKQLSMAIAATVTTPQGAAVKREEKEEKVCPISTRARSFFPYFSNNDYDNKAESSGPPSIFFENAGGTQVPNHVIDAVSSSLQSRHRAVAGAQSVVAAKATLTTILGASNYSIFLSANATTLLHALAQRYVQTGLLQAGDEIVLCSENHQANLQPWLGAAQSVGGVVRWWDFPMPGNKLAESFKSVLTARTRIVAVPHASNILGDILDVGQLARTVRQLTQGRAHVVVDGVAAAPHRYPAVDELGVDWYAISCHKMFGPHLGALCGRTAVLEQMEGETMTKLSFCDGLQLGTVNYEACEGVRGFGRYLMEPDFISSSSVYNSGSNNIDLKQSTEEFTKEYGLNSSIVREVFRRIETAEASLIRGLLKGLQSSSKVRIIGSGEEDASTRIPVVSFVHREIPSSQIAKACSIGGVICRNGTFLSSERLQKKHNVDATEGVVRFSLVHYNTISEVKYALSVLESIPNWF